MKLPSDIEIDSSKRSYSEVYIKKNFKVGKTKKNKGAALDFKT